MGKRLNVFIGGEQMLPQTVEVHVERSGRVWFVSVRGRSRETFKHMRVLRVLATKAEIAAFLGEILGSDQQEMFPDA